MLFWGRWRLVFATAAIALLLSGVPCKIVAQQDTPAPQSPGGQQPSQEPGPRPEEGAPGPDVGGGACWLTKQSMTPVGTVSGSAGGAVLAGAGIDVCAAWPACGTCVRMYEGDCRYVFPTFVMAYGVKDPTGPGKICACKVLACNLPWDPGGWNRGCIQELGCFDKPLLRDAGPFCNVLPGRKRSARVRFVPLEFSKQSFWRPGFVAIVESWEHKDGATTKKVSKHVIHPGGHATTTGVSQSDPVAQESEKKHLWHTTGPSIDEETRDYSFSDHGSTHHLKARRVQDAVCVGYYGEDKEGYEISSGCVPIPAMERPLVYQAYRDQDGKGSPFKGDQGERGKVLNIPNQDHANWVFACPTAISLAKNYGRVEKGGAEGEYKVDFYWGGYKGPPDCQVFSVYERKGTCNCFAEKGTKFEDCKKKCASQQDPKNVSACVLGIYCNKWRIARGAGTLPIQGINALTRSAAQTQNVSHMISHSLGRNCIFGYKQCVRFNGTTCYDEKYHTEDWSGKYYENPRDVFVGYATAQFAGEQVQQSNADPQKSSAKFFGVVGDPALREIKRSCIDVEDREGKSKICWYDTSESAGANVLCISGTGFDVSEYEIRSRSDMGVARTWLRKQQKVLRRYILVDAGDDIRRVACDDKYSIVLGSLSQDILDSMIVHNGQYVFPREFLERSIVKDSDDPCSDPRSKIVYYHESGGFTSDPGALSRCSHPVTQYYGPGREVQGCAYEYVSMDDYRPLTFSGVISENDALATGAALVSGTGQAHASVAVQSGDSAPVTNKLATDLELKPLNPYDRGLCIDNFPRHWYEPRYIFPSVQQTNPPQNESFKSYTKDRETEGSGKNEWCLLSNELTPTVTKNYVMLKFKAKDKNWRRGCNFYRIEAWGGGEAAAKTETGERRSGRPGQYSMVVLRNPNCTDEGCEAFSRNKGGKRVQDLELSIEVEVGEGGRSGTNKKSPATEPNDDLGVGGDTIVKFCVCNNGNCSKNPPGNGKKCYDIMKAVGGGSKQAGKLDANAIKDLVVSYRTITGDVLAGDDGATKLLLEGRAMFTKFPLEMNFPLYDQEGKMKEWLKLGIAEHFQGRSLPRELCVWKDRYYTYRIPGDFFIPGMGGCWKDGNDMPGLGESGAAMITCELWDNTRTPTFLDNGIEPPPEIKAQQPVATQPVTPTPPARPAAPTTPTGKCGNLPQCQDAGGKIRVTYKYCPWWARFMVSQWEDRYSCTGGIKTYTDTFDSVQAYEQYRNSWVKVKSMYGCDDESCVHFRKGYTNCGGRRNSC